MYEAALRRGQTIGGAIQNWTNTLYERQEEDKAFGAKLKSIESLVQSHAPKFGLQGEQLKQFLAVNPNESPKERYLRIGGFVEGSLKAAELEKVQLANQKAQQQLEQLKKTGEMYAAFQRDEQLREQERIRQEQERLRRETGQPAGGRYHRVDQAGATGGESALQRGTGEMSLLNSLARFSGPTEQPNAMQGASAFEFTPPPAASPAAPSVPTAPAPSAPASAAAPAAEAAPVYDVPAPPIPAWFKQSQAAALPSELNLSPEAKAIAAQLRRQYEESQDPSLRTISAPDLEPRKRKSITLDAEGIKAILSNPRILVESFADLAGDPYQQGLRRERLDRVMREQEQLRALEQMMRSRRAR
jgi:hypothetical protein